MYHVLVNRINIPFIRRKIIARLQKGVPSAYQATDTKDQLSHGVDDLDEVYKVSIINHKPFPRYHYLLLVMHVPVCTLKEGSPLDFILSFLSVHFKVAQKLGQRHDFGQFTPKITTCWSKFFISTIF